MLKWVRNTSYQNFSHFFLAFKKITSFFSLFLYKKYIPEIPPTDITGDGKLQEIVDSTLAAAEFNGNAVILAKYYIRKDNKKEALSVIRKIINYRNSLESSEIIWICKFVAGLRDNENVDDIISQCSSLSHDPECLLELSQYVFFYYYFY